MNFIELPVPRSPGALRKTRRFGGFGGGTDMKKDPRRIPRVFSKLGDEKIDRLHAEIGVVLKKKLYQAAFTWATRAAKPSLSKMAISERTLRSRAIPAFLSPFMKTE